MFPLDPASSILHEHARMMILLSHNDLVMLSDLFIQWPSGYAGLRGAGISQKGQGVCSLRECGQAQRIMEERMGKRGAGPLRKVSSVQATGTPHQQQTGQNSPGKHEAELFTHGASLPRTGRDPCPAPCCCSGQRVLDSGTEIERGLWFLGRDLRNQGSCGGQEGSPFGDIHSRVLGSQPGARVSLSILSAFPLALPDLPLSSPTGTDALGHDAAPTTVCSGSACLTESSLPQVFQVSVRLRPTLYRKKQNAEC